MYTITLEPKELQVLKVAIENAVFVTETALMTKTKAEAIKTNLDFLKALERKISAQVADQTAIMHSDVFIENEERTGKSLLVKGIQNLHSPNCQGQCGICDGTCDK